MTFFWTKLLAGQGLSNISLKSVSVLYGNFPEKLPIIHKHSNTILVLGRPFKLIDFLAALGLNTCSCYINKTVHQINASLRGSYII